MRGPNRRREGRRFSGAERFLAYQRILEGRSYVEIVAELDCSSNSLYRQRGAQKERAARAGEIPVASVADGTRGDQPRLAGSGFLSRVGGAPWMFPVDCVAQDERSRRARQVPRLAR